MLQNGGLVQWEGAPKQAGRDSEQNLRWGRGSVKMYGEQRQHHRPKITGSKLATFKFVKVGKGEERERGFN
jgi:hypothetical protein